MQQSQLATVESMPWGGHRHRRAPDKIPFDFPKYSQPRLDHTHAYSRITAITRLATSRPTYPLIADRNREHASARDTCNGIHTRYLHWDTHGKMMHDPFTEPCSAVKIEAWQQSQRRKETTQHRCGGLLCTVNCYSGIHNNTQSCTFPQLHNCVVCPCCTN